MKLRQLKQGYKCPNCKNYNLEELDNDHKFEYDHMSRYTGGNRIPFINKNKLRLFHCKICHADFKEENKK